MHTYPAGSVFRVDDEKPTYVYALRDGGGPAFYIGVTDDPAYRLRQHMKAGVPAVRARLNACKAPEMVILSVHKERGWAMSTERTLIDETPGLINQEQRIRRDVAHERHPVFSAMMQRVK